MKKELRISVVVPCYNQAQYLSDALQSVFEQSYSNWECIVVNDGSTDNTRDIASEWCNKDSRFRYIEKENGGVADARNKGIRLAKGDWILPLDGDDIIAKDYLKLAVDIILKKPDTGIIYCKANLFGAQEGYWDLPAFNIKELLIKNQIFNCAFFKKEDWERIGGYDTDMVYGREDWEFWINLLKTTQKEVVRLDYIGFFYRIKETSRNINLFTSKQHIQDTELKIYDKHRDVYTKYFGSFIHLLSCNKKNEEDIKNIKNSVSYRIGIFLTTPYRWLKKYKK